jgi:hypothetical protein
VPVATLCCLILLLFASTPQVRGQGDLPSVFPVVLQKNLISRFSVGEAYEDGILTNRLSGGSDTFTEASASFAYNWRRRRAEYVFDYRGSGRHYRRNSSLDVLTHDLGLSQIARLTPRLTWNVSYRFSRSPDYAGSLLQESLVNELAFRNPFPVALIGSGGGFTPVSSAAGATFVNPFPAGVELLPNTVDTLPQGFAPGDSLQTLRSIHTTHRPNTQLSYKLSPRTSFFVQGGFQGTRYRDENLLAGDNYSVSAGMSRLLSARTEMGLAYQGSRFELLSRSDRTLVHGVVFSFNRQLARSTFLTFTAGPTLNQHRGSEAISLPPLLSDLLGRPTLQREVSRMQPSWMGSAAVATSWHGLNLDVKYDRLISSTSGLGTSSRQEHYSARLGKQLTRRTAFSAAAVYSRSELLSILDPVRFSQRAFDATFTRELSGSLSLVAFARYSKLLTGLQASYLLSHNQFGIRFQYHLPRQGQT